MRRTRTMVRSVPTFHDIRQAIIENDVSRLRAILRRKKALVNEHDALGQEPLHLAAYQGHRELVQVLVENGACLGHSTNDGLKPLDLAMNSKDQETISCLQDIVEKACMDLVTASIKGDSKKATLLIEKQGAEVDHTDALGQTPLHTAAYHNQPGVIKVLLDHGANIDARANDGMTPLDLAEEAGGDESVDLLRQRAEALGIKLHAVNAFVAGAESDDMT